MQDKDYSVISWHDHDIKVVERLDKNKIYFTTQVKQMGKAITISQAYDINYQDLTGDEQAKAIEDLLTHFVEYAERTK